jgi:large subunit ribosomal protein L21
LEAIVYAIVRAGGRQYRVEAGEVVRFQKLPGEVGEKVSLGEVLLVSGDAGVQLGAPLVSGALVEGTVVEQGRGEKIRVFKYKKRKHYRRTRGHRQSFTAVRIDAVKG